MHPLSGAFLLMCIYVCGRLQVSLIKQEKVACLVDSEATLGLDPKDPYTIQVCVVCVLCGRVFVVCVEMYVFVMVCMHSVCFMYMHTSLTLMHCPLLTRKNSSWSKSLGFCFAFPASKEWFESVFF